MVRWVVISIPLDGPTESFLIPDTIYSRIVYSQLYYLCLCVNLLNSLYCVTVCIRYWLWKFNTNVQMYVYMK